MEIFLTQEVSEEIIQNGISDEITEFDSALNIFFNTRNYGNDLQTIYIGIICVSQNFDFFFKERKAVYKKGTEIIEQEGRKYETTNTLKFDIKLNYEQALLANAKNELKKMFAQKFLTYLPVLDIVKAKSFDRNKFELDLTQYLNQYISE